ncbi:alanine racemase [Marinoscillum furvescens]|nr:alanine racemase [Marinoscillum furvescens]
MNEQKVDIKTPTLLVDERKVRHNLRTMLAKARHNGSSLRPHFKTHQSATVAQWIRDEGIDKATVSSVGMAKYFADAGWEDLLIAFPYNPLEYEEMTELANKCKLSVTIVSKEALDHLNAHVDAELDYYIKVDVGTHRTGISSTDVELINHLATSANPKHRLKGILAHAGHTYKPLDAHAARVMFDHAIEQLMEVKQAIGQEELIISYGDTPSCSLLDEFPGIDELRPGNFVFYDVMQHYFGSCTLAEIAVCMVCPVVAIHPERCEVVVYGGGVHFAKESISELGENVFGKVVALSGRSWDSFPLARVDRLSQEHGIIKASEEFVQALKIGDLVGILPVHSCLTADIQPHYQALDGTIIEKWNKS